MKNQKFLAPLAFALGLSVVGMATAQSLTMGVRGGPESMDPHF
jgi:peptide/nickel transport system substrate-binding protein